MRHFFTKLCRVIQYIPIIWNNEDYDYAFILELLKYKLTRTSDKILKDDIVVDTEDIVNEINKVIYFIEKFQEDEYDDIDELGDTSVITPGLFVHRWEEADKKRQADWDMIFDLMKKNMQKWWD